MVTGDLGFQEEIIDGFIVRKFENSIDEHKLYWHLDAADRFISVVEGDNWKIQMDNELPITLIKNCDYFVQKETYHRLIKGNNDLILKIKEL